MPPVAPVASTTVSTITRRSWSDVMRRGERIAKAGGRVAHAGASSNSISSSSSRASSWSAISLKAVPRRANSSLPSTSTRRSSRPRGNRVRGGGQAVERGHDRAADRVGDERDQEQRDEQPDQQPLVRPHDRVVDPSCGVSSASAGCRFLHVRWWRACGSGCRSRGASPRYPGSASGAPVSARGPPTNRPWWSTTSLSLESSRAAAQARERTPRRAGHPRRACGDAAVVDDREPRPGRDHPRRAERSDVSRRTPRLAPELRSCRRSRRRSAGCRSRLTASALARASAGETGPCRSRTRGRPAPGECPPFSSRCSARSVQRPARRSQREQGDERKRKPVWA